MKNWINAELDWEEEEEEEGEGREGAAGAGAARDDNAVIQFHSQKHVYDVRFQGYGVVKQVRCKREREIARNTSFCQGFWIKKNKKKQAHHYYCLLYRLHTPFFVLGEFWAGD